ncbi:DNA replication initiation control protein YabA [Staphylococcus condimenti]|uniref:DNA replication initiation control protein YabA n=1 Tax=Staphylococcus condimenti TaxID=70255 RepID=A0A143PD63_9STAP|nr:MULTISPECIES: DNA replication initiation control protein YabA [Staphylococcus]AMY05704.1 DNA replication protein YabA [Staphylococcus condimenti]APR61911.1 DNA replication initiation control protein YabA [Staphylococcus condimenti]MDK8646257.1 DNA replication initiation control protein YabA [Staphylococcus condimenti]OFO99145.1 DNA replication protein YabA [Staphylococcus sp. HMSC065E08]PNZ57461.1 DNA replication initiation control protein YabA [Staphylococcus condimenti]
MDRRDLMERLMRLESNVQNLYQEMAELKTIAMELVEENVALEVENNHLKRLIGRSEEGGLHSDAQDNIETHESKEEHEEHRHRKHRVSSKENLAILYQEGFHICKGDLFGKHRHGEDCLFCLQTLEEQS